MVGKKRDVAIPPKATLEVARRIEAAPIATRATTDYLLLDTWIAEMGSPATRKTFAKTVSQFLDTLPMGLRQAKLEDVREAIEAITAGRADSTAKQYALRVKSFKLPS